MRVSVKLLLVRRPLASTAYTVTFERLAASIRSSNLALSTGDTGSPSEKNTIDLRPGVSASDRMTPISASVVS